MKLNQFNILKFKLLLIEIILQKLLIMHLKMQIMEKVNLANQKNIKI